MADAPAENGESDTDIDPEVMEDAEAWRSLDREEQDAILDEGLARLEGESGDGEWRHYSEAEQADTIAAIERDADALSDTERAMQAALEQTWTAEVFGDLEDVPTVPFECRELTAREQDQLRDAGRILMTVEEQAGDLDEDADIEDIEGIEFESEHFDELEDIDGWMTHLLADVTADPAFDEERFRTGERMRSNTRRLLFLELFLRYQEEGDRAMKFRQERAG